MAPTFVDGGPVDRCALGAAFRALIVWVWCAVQLGAVLICSSATRPAALLVLLPASGVLGGRAPWGFIRLCWDVTGYHARDIMLDLWELHMGIST